MRNCATLLTSLTYYFVFLVIVLEMADVETPKAYCGLAGLGLTQAVALVGIAGRWQLCQLNVEWGMLSLFHYLANQFHKNLHSTF